MAVSTPKIKKIIRMTEFDQICTSITEGNMYMCTDSLKLYYDSTATTRDIYAYTGVKTINDLMYNITPNYGTSYYCWEDNSLWIWMNKWITIWSDSQYPSAYIYDDYPSSSSPSSLNGIYTDVLDNNGLLGDGSVVIRDINRIIKGKLYVNDDNDNLTFSSYLGGAIRFLPNGKMTTDGEMLIGDEGKSFIRSEWNVMNNQIYVDYSEEPGEDPSIEELKKSSHRYMVFHEGNLDASLIKPLTGEDIYNKLMTDPNLPDDFDFSVTQISGKHIDDLSLVGHTHTTSEISDFITASRAQADVEIRTVMNALAGDGLTIVPNSASSTYTMSANSFTLSFRGGARGSGTVNHLTDTVINLTVDPTQHIHSNYIQRMDNLQTQINQINAMDPNDYYLKTQIDTMINNVSGTAVPTPGKPLLVNNDGILPAPSLAANKLTNERTITFKGDIQGVLTTDFDTDEDVWLDASNIVSVTPVTGKALLVDSNGNLPGNAETAMAMDHNINFVFTGETSGTVTTNLDRDNGASDTTVMLDVTLSPTPVKDGGNVLTKDDLDVTVPELDSNKLLDEKYIPIGANGTMNYAGTFSPTVASYPTDDPINGQYWEASTDGTFGPLNEDFSTGDWLIYINDNWTSKHFGNVLSVNGKTGNVVLTSTDIPGLLLTFYDKDSIGYFDINTIHMGSTFSLRKTVEGLFIDTNSSSFTTIIGNGSATSFTINHNLDSRVMVEFQNNITGEACLLDYKYIDSNTILVTSKTVLARNEMVVKVISV